MMKVKVHIGAFVSGVAEVNLDQDAATGELAIDILVDKTELKISGFISPGIVTADESQAEDLSSRIITMVGDIMFERAMHRTGKDTGMREVAVEIGPGKASA